MTTQRGASRTLNPGEHRLAFTRRVNDQMAGDSKFAKFVYQSLLRFNRGDWGNVGAEDWKANDADLEALNSGSWDGRILASYVSEPLMHWTRTSSSRVTIWIIRNTAEEDGTQAIMVLFPDEY